MKTQNKQLEPREAEKLLEVKDSIMQTKSSENE